MKRHEFLGYYANLPSKERDKKCNLTWNEVYKIAFPYLSGEEKED